MCGNVDFCFIVLLAVGIVTSGLTAFGALGTIRKFDACPSLEECEAIRKDPTVFPVVCNDDVDACTCRSGSTCSSELHHTEWCYVDSMESCDDTDMGGGGPWSEKACQAAGLADASRQRRASDSCRYSNDGECDEPSGSTMCADGTDCTDCNTCQASVSCTEDQCSSITGGNPGASNRVCCPAGMQKYGDGSACTGNGNKCKLWGNPSLSLCSSVNAQGESLCLTGGGGSPNGSPYSTAGNAGSRQATEEDWSANKCCRCSCAPLDGEDASKWTPEFYEKKYNECITCVPGEYSRSSTGYGSFTPCEWAGDTIVSTAATFLTIGLIFSIVAGILSLIQICGACYIWDQKDKANFFACSAGVACLGDFCVSGLGLGIVFVIMWTEGFKGNEILFGMIGAWVGCIFSPFIIRHYLGKGGYLGDGLTDAKVV